MQLGVVFPQREIGAEPGAIARFATGVEELGYRHLLVYEHVVGAAAPDRVPGPYDAGAAYHEPFVLFGFLAACCGLEFTTGVLVAPQRQTALVAKQAAEVDLLSGGRLRLGLGIGWNRIEYEVLGAEFGTRGRRLDEQIDLLRALWRDDLVAVEAAGGTVQVGLAPPPVQRPIPLWLGGSSAAAHRRIGRLGDGWYPKVEPGPELDAALAAIAAAAGAAGRDPATIGMEGRVAFTGDPDATRRGIARWAAAGATHCSVDTMDAGLSGPEEHLAVLAQVSSQWGCSPT